MGCSLQEIVLTSSPDGPITVYDASSGSKLAYFNGSRSPEKGLAVVGNKLIAASHVSPDTGRGFVHLYHWWCSTVFHKLPMPEPVAPLAATRDGMHLFAGGISGHIHSISLPLGDVIQSFPAHSKPITCLEINGDGSLILSGSDDGTISVFPIYQVLDSLSCNNSALQRFSGHKSSVTSITIGMGGCNCTIISCSLDSTCKFWSLMQKNPLRTISFPCTTLAVTMDPFESEFYATGSDGFMYKGVLKVTSELKMKQGQEELMTWNMNQGPITSMATINWGKDLVTASEDGKLCIWDIEKGELIKVLDQQAGRISHLIIVRGVKDGGVPAGRMPESIVCCGKMVLGSSEKELSRPIKELIEMEEELAASIKDRTRAIDTLELAIGAYEKLLKLILKEAKSGSSKLIHEND